MHLKRIGLVWELNIGFKGGGTLLKDSSNFRYCRNIIYNVSRGVRIRSKTGQSGFPNSVTITKTKYKRTRYAN